MFNAVKKQSLFLVNNEICNRCITVRQKNYKKYRYRQLSTQTLTSLNKKNLEKKIVLKSTDTGKVKVDLTFTTDAGRSGSGQLRALAPAPSVKYKHFSLIYYITQIKSQVMVIFLPQNS